MRMREAPPNTTVSLNSQRLREKLPDSDAGRGRGQEEKGTTEDEMAGCNHRLDGREFE